MGARQGSEIGPRSGSRHRRGIIDNFVIPVFTEMTKFEFVV